MVGLFWSALYWWYVTQASEQYCCLHRWQMKEGQVVSIVYYIFLFLSSAKTSFCRSATRGRIAVYLNSFHVTCMFSEVCMRAAKTFTSCYCAFIFAGLPAILNFYKPIWLRIFHVPMLQASRLPYEWWLCILRCVVAEMRSRRLSLAWASNW